MIASSIPLSYTWSSWNNHLVFFGDRPWQFLTYASLSLGTPFSFALLNIDTRLRQTDVTVKAGDQPSYKTFKQTGRACNDTTMRQISPRNKKQKVSDQAGSLDSERFRRLLAPIQIMGQKCRDQRLVSYLKPLTEQWNRKLQCTYCVRYYIHVDAAGLAARK